MATAKKKPNVNPELSVGEQRELRTPVHGQHGRACPRSRMRSGEGGASHPAFAVLTLSRVPYESR
jgi:hypothetical protein